MRQWVFFAVLLLVWGCSAKSPQTSDSVQGGRPRLVLNAIPRQGFAPLRVSFHATLQHVSETDQEFYCQKEEWDFGDGAVSSDEPHCETFHDGAKVATEFFMDHLYEDPGNYTAAFTLGDKKLRSGKISIVVIESLRESRSGR
jgi:PKD repeat protein